MLEIIASANPLDHIVQHPFKQTEVGGLTFLSDDGLYTVFSNQIAMQILAAVLLVVLIPMAVRSRAGGETVDCLTPRGLGNFFESICQYLRKEVAQPALGEYTDRFIPYIWTVFFFILFMNLMGMLPLEPITKLLFGVGIGGTPTGNIFVTGTLAVCTLFMIVVNGLRIGGMQFIAHFCPGPLWLAPLLVPVEIVGLVFKIFALAVRLFANMIAGHILLAVLISFIGMAASGLGSAGGVAIAVPVVLGSVAFYLLELFVALLQAFIFTFLTTLFIGMSIVFEHGEHQAEHAH